MKFEGQVAIVTGAGRNIGEDISKLLAKNGATIAVVDLDKGRGDKVASDIVAAGGRARAVRADLSSSRQAAALVDRCRAPGVRLTCLVNSASLFKLDRAPTATAEDFDRHMAINLRAPMLLSQALAPIQPSSPRLFLNTFVAVFLGGLIALAVVIGREMADRRVRSVEDVLAAVPVPLIGQLPSTKKRRRLFGGLAKNGMQQRLLGGQTLATGKGA